MARLFLLDSQHCNPKLKSSISQLLRASDEAIVLPQAYQSCESGSVKNVVFNLDGLEKDLNADIFSPNWFCGASAIEISAAEIEPILRDPVKRARALAALNACIHSEFSDEMDVSIGPDLECDDDERDLKPWTSGFDSPGCCVGLFSALQSKKVDDFREGSDRSHTSYLLFCKAGGGVAAQSFHTRLSGALKKGRTLEEALSEGGVPGAQALRRVASAGERNRSRILCQAAEAIGLTNFDTLCDAAASGLRSDRLAVTTMNVTTNSILRRPTNSGLSNFIYYSGAVDIESSFGILSCSNAADGFIAVTDDTARFKTNVRNSAQNSIPFCSERLLSNRQAIDREAENMKRLGLSDIHADSTWLKQRFVWKNRKCDIQMYPPSLLGTHTPEHFSNCWLRELGLSNCKVLRFAPEIVCLAGVEPARLRAAARYVLSK